MLGSAYCPLSVCILAPVVYVCISVLTYLSALVSEELPSVVDDLFICEVGVRLLLTNTQHLPQSDPERPHVAGRGELTLGTHNHADRLSHLCNHNLHQYQNYYQDIRS